jgi:hypothetical protein
MQHNDESSLSKVGGHEKSQTMVMNFFFITIVGKALGKTGIPKRMLANEVKLAIKDVGKALGKTR